VGFVPVRRALRYAASVLCVAGCASIVGIDDHAFQGAASEQCQQYCDTVMKNCVGPNQVYSEMTTCLGVCAHLPPGDPVEPLDDNSIVCRARQAALADTEPNFYCPLAGPGGGGTCGSNCAGYCTLLKAVCPTQAAPLTHCEQQCSALKDTGAFNVVANHEGDTIQCRLVHVSSATVDPTTHCLHTDLHPTPPWCIEDQTAHPSCADFCRLALAACTGDDAVYESSAQCMAVCAHLPLGTNGDRDQNTVGCRQWHSYNALLDPDSHCPHTGPGGDSHCGADAPNDTGNCHAYCILLAAACPTEFMATYPGLQADCQTACSNQPVEFGSQHDSHYKVSAGQSGNTFACRLLHVSRALTDPTQCASALGGGVCQ
jgi:hypothetical protein